MKTAQQAAAAWAASAGRAATAWTEGVQGYSGDWAGATTRQKNAWVQGLLEAQAQNRWENGVNRVGTTGWKQATTSKAGNFTTGFSAGASKQASAIAKILSAEQNIVGSLPPRGTFEQNKQRATAVMDQLHALKGSLGAS